MLALRRTDVWIAPNPVSTHNPNGLLAGILRHRFADDDRILIAEGMQRFDTFVSLRFRDAGNEAAGGLRVEEEWIGWVAVRPALDIEEAFGVTDRFDGSGSIVYETEAIDWDYIYGKRVDGTEIK